jgi:photosystem II stability/assembly factor-like uncharacterized protein
MLKSIVFLLAASAAFSQGIPESLYQGMQWRNIGPFRGGRSDAVAGVQQNPHLYYFGGVGGGLWKTEDSGITWTNITDGQLKTSSVGAIEVAASDPNVLYLGMGENEARGVAISHGDGVYKSADAGRTWKHIGLDATRSISRIRIHPANPDVVYVAAQGAPFGATKDRGIYRSKDGGATWKNVLFVDETTGASELAMDPANPRILYAAFWDYLRKPWEIRSGGPGSGIYKSTDGGDTWQTINEGLPKLMGKIGISVSANSQRLYAIVEADPAGGVYRSDNGGKTWQLMNDSNWGLKSRSWYYMKIFADPKNPDVVWVLNASVFRSIDGGRNWTQVPTPHGDNHDMWINPNDPNNMIEANDGGAVISFDSGRSWSTQENQPTAQFYRVNIDDRFPYWVYAGQQDNTTVAIKSAANGPGIGWKDWHQVGGCESAWVGFDPKKPDKVYATCYQGQITEYDDDTSDARDVQEYPSLPLALPSREMKYRYNWNGPMIVSNSDPKVLYHASQVLMRSENQGRTWTQISPDLTHPDDKTQGYGGGPITNEGAGGEVYDTIYYVAEALKDKNTLWTGSDDGVVQMTRDGGKNWKKVALPGMADAQINAIEISPFDPATIYIAATRYKWNDMAPYIFKSTDSGATWNKLVDGIPAESWAHVVREDPEKKDLLYAGTETGVFVSFNGGAKWQPLQLNLPTTPVNDLKIHTGDLVAATSGRAFWILDDLTPLRQMSPVVAQEPVHLFTPRVAIRATFGGGFGGGLGPDNALGKNPPSGAILDFSVAKAGPVTIEILDSTGKPVRKMSNIAAKAGMNRSLWDLRYDTPALVPGIYLFGSLRGRKVVPGTYQVRLTVAGESRTAKIEVQKDPRVSATPQQFAEQNRLLSEIDSEIDDLHKSVIRMRAVHSQIEEILKRAKDSGADSAALQTAGKALEDKLDAEADQLVQKRTVDGQTVINFPTKLDHHLVALHNFVDGAEADVTDGARLRAADLAKVWKEQKAETESLLGTQLDAFNKQIAAAKLAYVTVPK